MELKHDPHLDEWDQWAEWPLAIAAAAFLVSYAWPILQPGLGDGTILALHALGLVAWAVFVVDYFGRLIIARHRWQFVRRNLFDLAIVALPLLQNFRSLQLIKILKVLNKRATVSFRGQVALYVASSVALVLFVGALAMLDAERGVRGSNINDFETALWWAVVTITSVGYGDHYPLTVTGRLVGACLMMSGIALLGVVTASMAAWLIDRFEHNTEESTHTATHRDVLALRAEIAQLRTALAERDHIPADTPASPKQGKAETPT